MALIFLATLAACPNDLGLAAEIPNRSDFRVFKTPPGANDFTMVTPDGSPIKLSDLKGSVVVLNFWRRDCHYCVMEKKHLKDMVQKLNRPDVKVVCVNFWDNPDEVRSYGRKNGGELLVAARSDRKPSVMENMIRGRLMGYYVLNEAGEAIYEVKGFPSSYVIDKEGRVVATHVGMAEWSAPTVRNWITGLVGQIGPSDHAAPDQYELPSWIERLLSGLPNGIPTLGSKSERRAQAGPAN
ncbi:MAG: TlpA family protein disulfide reductase [Desulfomonile tiedjei]|nr:TlpA family protein disulfide reductase [Desulfomonile tiedjei]